MTWDVVGEHSKGTFVKSEKDKIYITWKKTSVNQTNMNKVIISFFYVFPHSLTN
jgi:hypothetical protein